MARGERPRPRPGAPGATGSPAQERAGRRGSSDSHAKREFLDARPDGVLAVTASNSAAMFVSADPATHDDLRAAVNATTEAIINALAKPGPRSPITPTELANAVAQLDPLPEEGTPLAI